MFALTGLIEKYVYDDANVIYFLLFLLTLDTITGIAKSFKNKTFGSRRMPRVLLTTLTYFLMLAISWQAGKYYPLFEFLPGLLYGGFISVLFVSIAENFSELGLFPKSIFEKIKDRLKLK